MATIRNPAEWGADQLRHAAHHIEQVFRSLAGSEANTRAELPAVRRIEVSDIRGVLEQGVEDFKACRTDVVFLCVVYPLCGLVLARFAFDYDLVPLLFPIISGFALLGPVAAVGLYEMSRRREQGQKASWSDAFGIVRSPAFGAVLVLGLVLTLIFLAWMGMAQLIYLQTLGPEPPASLAAFLGDVFTTGAGWTMIVVGMGVGFLFALLVLATSVVSFPLLLDRDVGIGPAIWTSLRVARANPVPIALWGLVVAAGLVIGSLPLLLGLIVVMPILGHATWHLYRKTVER